MNSFTTPSELTTWVDSTSRPAVSSFFTANKERIIARAPGRLDLMGGIADYSGSLVLQWPIHEATWAIVQQTTQPVLEVLTVRPDAETSFLSTTFDLAGLTTENNEPITYLEAKELLTLNPDTRWAAYVIGVFVVLMRERRAIFSTGAKIMIVSDVPEGKGVSSSAAIEVATMRAVADAYGISLDKRELGIYCQKVENEVVGAPCGIMDQMASACAESGSLMALRCRPAELLGNVALPAGIAIWGIDSGVRHSVLGADYGSVRTAAFMGLAIIEKLINKSLDGYLTKLSPSEIAPFVSSLPECITGEEFAKVYGDVPDSQSRLIPDRNYAVRAATLHPINEHHRVSLFRELLSLPVTPKRLSLLGELMFQSHASYSSVGLGTPQTDRLVALVREFGSDNGVYGAKITGGGSGGTVAILGNPDADKTIDTIAAKYQAETGLTPHIFRGTSTGAYAFGVHRI